MILPIVKAPHPVLAKQAAPVKKIDKDILALVENMKETLLSCHDPEGIGLAAPQIGESLQLFIVKEDTNEPFFVFINPTIVLSPLEPKSASSKKEKEKLEGCLSLGDVWGVVKRSPRLTCSWTDTTGLMHTQEFSGFFATIIQHEYDHLQGILFPKRTIEQNGRLYRTRKTQDGEEEFVPINL
jgi:peptide deformylase